MGHTHGEVLTCSSFFFKRKKFSLKNRNRDMTTMSCFVNETCDLSEKVLVFLETKMCRLNKCELEI